MKLVIDTNRLISALIKDGKTREIVSSDNFEFYTIEHSIKEVLDNKNIIAKKTGMKREDIELLFLIILEKLNIVSDERIKPFMEEAINIMKNIDETDSPFIACALSFDNDGIYSEDKHFQKQSKVRIWKTKDLIKCRKFSTSF